MSGIFGSSGVFGNIASLAVQAALGVATGGASLMVSTALRAVMSAIGDQIIQQVGQQLGLPQSAIDVAQGAFHGAIGDPAGAAANFEEAVSGLAMATGASPQEEGQFASAAQDYTNQMTRMMLDGAKGERERAAEAGGGGEGETFLVKLAIALGGVLDKKMNRMLALSEQIGGLGEITQKNQSQLGKLTGEMQAVGQEVGLLSNALSNTTKSAGEGLSTIARKN
jgi:hypothetical protein